MTERRGLLLGLRALFASFFVGTSLYCLLAYVPFSYQQFLKPALVPALGTFAALHPYLYWVAMAAGVVSVWSDVRRPATRLCAIGFITAAAIAGALLLWRPVLTGLGNDASSLLFCVVALVPILWVAFIDHLGHSGRVVWNDVDDHQRIFSAALRAAPALAALYAILAVIRIAVEQAAPFRGTELAIAVAWSLVLHAIGFMTIFVVLDLIRAVSRLARRAALVQFWMTAVLGGACVASVMFSVVLAAISFSGWPAVFVAAVFGLAATALVSGLAVRLRAGTDAVENGLEPLMAPFVGWPSSSATARTLWAAALIGLATILALRTAAFDWNYLLQKLSVLAIWLLAFTFFYITAARRSPLRREVPVLLFAAALMPLGAYRALQASTATIPSLLGDRTLDVTGLLDRYAGYDVSFRILYGLVTRPSSAPDPDLYSYLQENTNIPQETPVAPTSVDLVEGLAPAPGPKPDIFLIVVDSLRRDYLSPYNADVTFTPSIGQFAAEGQVFTNAFTHYGATGLSEPSIWTGSMLVHKQYVTPFAPMNALAKLLDVERYQNFISRDSILRIVVPSTLPAIDLDKGVANKDYDLCRSVAELQDKLRDTPADRPVFAYTQPQNLHVSSIARGGAATPEGTYPGFYAPYAARLKRIDECFGRFIQHLKDSGRYDRSIVILTADHGDSLGEAGRWGHAYTIFPEIVRIPLLVHVPKALVSRMADPGQLAFSTDITPTLYALTGHMPTATSPVLGRPLVKDAFDIRPTQQWHLIASSYGPVYGTLRDNGRRLYIVDTINYQDYDYDLDADPRGEHNLVTPEVRREQQALIREGVGRINQLFQIPAKPGS